VAIQGDSRTLISAPTVQRRSSSIYLSNEKGEKRILAKYSPQTTTGSEALFFFPRNNDKGEPLLKPDNVSLIFNFKYESDDDDLVRMFERIEIKVREITRENTVIF
jgi:hypothetical protein